MWPKTRNQRSLEAGAASVFSLALAVMWWGKTGSDVMTAERMAMAAANNVYATTSMACLGQDSRELKRGFSVPLLSQLVE